MTTKIVFMGTPNFSVPILNALIANDDYEVAAVMTQPDRPVGRKRVLTPTPVKEAAVAAGIRLLQPEIFYFLLQGRIRNDPQRVLRRRCRTYGQ